jgi:hypothetical protein
VSFRNPFFHHLCERWSIFGIQPRSARITELAYDLYTVLFGPSSNLILLDRNRILLPVLG